MVHYGKFRVHSKIIVDDKALEHRPKIFDYSGCDISLDIDKRCTNTVNRFQHMWNGTPKNKMRRERKLTTASVTSVMKSQTGIIWQ